MEEMSLPKVDDTEDESGYDGKVGKVETHRSSGGDREWDMVSRTDGTVCSDGSGDNDVTNSTVRQL
jgi:hypothetical protein